MKKYFILLAIAHILNSIAMEDPQSMTGVYEKLESAFHAFGLSSEGYSINTYHPATTPDGNVPRWHVIGSHIEITKDIRSNPDLVEFATYCAAADVHNYGHTKRALAYVGSYAAAVGAPAITTYLSANNPACCSLILATSLPLLALVTPLGIDDKLFDAINTRLATAAFKKACQKLVEEKKFKPLATYYAFAKLIRHTPLSSNDQHWIIERSLNAKNYSIESVIRAKSVESYIVDSEDKRVASSFYPPNEPK